MQTPFSVDRIKREVVPSFAVAEDEFIRVEQDARRCCRNTNKERISFIIEECHSLLHAFKQVIFTCSSTFESGMFWQGVSLGVFVPHSLRRVCVWFFVCVRSRHFSTGFGRNVFCISPHSGVWQRVDAERHRRASPL